MQQQQHHANDYAHVVAKPVLKPRPVSHQPSLLSTRCDYHVSYTPPIIGGASCRLPPAPVNRWDMRDYYANYTARQELATPRNLFQTPEYAPPSWKRPWWGELKSNRKRSSIYVILFGPPHRHLMMHFCMKSYALGVIASAERYRFLGGVWRRHYWAARETSPLYGVCPLWVWGAPRDDWSRRVSPFKYLDVDLLEVDPATWQPAPAVRTRSLLDSPTLAHLDTYVPAATIKAITGITLSHPLTLNVGKCEIMSRLTQRERLANTTQLEQLAYDIYRKLPSSSIKYKPFCYHEDAPS